MPKELKLKKELLEEISKEETRAKVEMEESFQGLDHQRHLRMQLRGSALSLCSIEVKES